MDYKILIIPGVVIVLGIIFMIFMSARGKKVILQIGNVEKIFKYQMKDCFGAPQEDTLDLFFRNLRSSVSQ